MATNKQTSGQRTRSAAEAIGVDNPVEGEQDTSGAELQAFEEFRAGLGNSNALQNLMDWCVERMATTEADQWAVMEAEVARILRGEDATAVLSENKPINGKDNTGKPFRINGFTLQPTDFSEGWMCYASINATIDRDGTTAVINCGGAKVIATLRRLEELDAIPCLAMIKGTQTRAGYTVLDLVIPS